MVSPEYLKDFALGFSLNKGLISSGNDVERWLDQAAVPFVDLILLKQQCH
jgi:formate dehydrogenase assembly factor FdhD